MKKFKCKNCGMSIFKCYFLGEEKICEGFVGSGHYKNQVMLHQCKPEEIKE